MKFLKIMAWIIGLPIGIFVLMVIYQLLPGGPTPTYMETEVANCKREVNSTYVGGNTAKAIGMKTECDALERSTHKPNPSATYR
jgi:hypothetical protein